MAENEEIIKSLMSLGLTLPKAKETIKNSNLTKTLQSILHEVRLTHITF